jgi:uncharacterized membrane protein YfcA
VIGLGSSEPSDNADKKQNIHAQLLMDTTIVPIIGVFVPIVAIVMGIGIGMLSIFLEYRKRERMFALYHQERMAAIEKGMDLPPLPEEFFSEGKRKSPHDMLLGGLICCFLGVTLFVALYFAASLKPALFALMPLGIGLALLIYYFTVGRKQALALEEAKKARAAEATRRPAS